MPSINPKEFEVMEKKAKFFEQESKSNEKKLAELQKKFSALEQVHAGIAAEHGEFVKEKEDEAERAKGKGKKSKKLKLKAAKKAKALAQTEAAAVAAAEAEVQREEDLDVYRNLSATYRGVAAALPDVSLKQVLIFQDKYILADEDSSGLIDAPELAGLLSSCLKQKVDLGTAEKLIKEVDTDGSGQLDFLETMIAGDRYMKAGKPDIKQTPADGKGGEKDSKACTIS